MVIDKSFASLNARSLLNHTQRVRDSGMTPSLDIKSAEGFGEYDSRWSRLYFKMANGLLKSAVGGPKRWEGLPYRGPAGSLVASLTAEGLLTLSDGEGVCLMAFNNSRRAARRECTSRKA